MPRVTPPPEGNVMWQRFSRLSAVKGGTFGLQIGGQASVAAGPVGRNLSAETDYKLSAEIYSYSKTNGLFAGINLAGTKWEIDSKANQEVYGEGGAGDVKRLLSTSGFGGTPLVEPFLNSLRLNIGPLKP